MVWYFYPTLYQINILWHGTSILRSTKSTFYGMVLLLDVIIDVYFYVHKREMRPPIFYKREMRPPSDVITEQTCRLPLPTMLLIDQRLQT